jgi:low affinity Fe/Cu permease
MTINESFNRFSHRASKLLGSSYAFIVALLIVVMWLATGPIFHFSDTWQLIINTGTTIVTFLMVFVIQNSQNRDAIGLHLKIDELIRANKRARNSMIDLAKLSDEQLASLEEEFMRICSADSEQQVGSEVCDPAGSPPSRAPARSGAQPSRSHRPA